MPGAGDRVLRGQAAQVGEGEQGFRADHDGEIPLELGQLARRIVSRNLAALNQGDVRPVLRMEARDVHFRFPGTSSWAIDAVGRDHVETWLRRMVTAGVQHHADDVVAVGPPWRMTLVMRGTDRCTGPVGTVVYDNRYVIWGVAKWGRITDYEVYEDTEKATAFDAYLARALP